MKKVGFTLVELLAVIIILAVVALITTPMVLGVIEGSKKGAIKSSAYGLMEAANIYYATNMLNTGEQKIKFVFEEGKQISEQQLQYKGKVEKGSMYLYSDGKQALCISDGKYVAIKNVDEEEVRITSGRCSYNETTESYETVGICQDLQNEVDRLKKENQKKLEELENKYKSEKEQLIADYEEQKKTIENTYKEQIEELNRRISELENNLQKNIEQIATDYEAQMKTQQETYETQIQELNNQLNTFKNGGTATSAQILTGKTAYVKGQLITGSMKDYSASIQTATTSTSDKTKSTFRINGTNLQIIPAIGYWGTWSWTKSNITVTANSIGITADKIAAGQTVVGVSGNYTSDATATSTQILTGKTAYVNGTKVTGSMVNRGAVTSSLNAGSSYTIPAGYHDGKGKITANSLASQTSGTATASQILSGQTAWVNGKQVTGTMANNGSVTKTMGFGEKYVIPAGYTSGGTISSPKNKLKSWTPNYGEWINSSSMITRDKYIIEGSVYFIATVINGGTISQGATPTCDNGGSVTLLSGNNKMLVYYVTSSTSGSTTCMFPVTITRDYNTNPNATLKEYYFIAD